MATVSQESRKTALLLTIIYGYYHAYTSQLYRNVPMSPAGKGFNPWPGIVRALARQLSVPIIRLVAYCYTKTTRDGIYVQCSVKPHEDPRAAQRNWAGGKVGCVFYSVLRK
jgi:hypothetical protein